MTVEIQVRCRGRADIAEFQSAGTKFAAIIAQYIISGFHSEVRTALTREDRMNLKFAFIATPRVLRVRASASGYPLG